jgi:hypothetical protein
MEDLKCDYPGGYKLNLWAEVLKTIYANEKLILDDTFCILESEIGGKIKSIEDILVRVLNTSYSLNSDSVSISIEYKVIIIALVEEEEQVVAITNTYEQIITLDQFDPPLMVDEFKYEVDQAAITLKNWRPGWVIQGDCEDPNDPWGISPTTGTLLRVRLLVYMIVKLSRMQNICVYGELNTNY